MDIRTEIREEGRIAGWRKGWRKGHAEGKEEGRQEVILNMLKKSADMTFISEVTGLPVKEIKKFKNGTQ